MLCIIKIKSCINCISAPNTDSSECSVSIHNDTDYHVKFKVKVTESQLFVAKPNIGLINAGCIQIVVCKWLSNLI